MNELLKEAFHTYQIYLTSSGVLDTHDAKLGILKWPDVAQSAIALVEAIEEDQGNKETIRAVLKKDLESALLEPVKSLFQAALTRAVSLSGKKIGDELLHATKSDTETDPIKLKDTYIERINSIFEFLEKETDVKYPKLKNQKEIPVRTKDVA